jgi:DNA-binding transcriptional MerR regulator
MLKKHFLLREVARIVGTTPYRINYAIANGHVPETEERVNNHRLFTEEDIMRIKAHFSQPIKVGRKPSK